MGTIGDRNAAAFARLRAQLPLDAPPPFSPTPTPVPVLPAFDEAQLVGEVLDWLQQHGYLKVAALAELQQAFFQERDRE